MINMGHLILIGDNEFALLSSFLESAIDLTESLLKTIFKLPRNSLSRANEGLQCFYIIQFS